MKLLLIRHGHTPSMDKGLFLGITDEALSPLGRQQVDELRQRLHGVPLHSVLSSPLQRARESANLFCCNRDHEIRICDALAERNFGAFERCSYDDLLRMYPDLVATWNANPWNFTPPDGESADAFQQRVTAFLFDELLPTVPSSHTVALFTHQGVIRSLLTEAMHFNRDQIWRFAIAPGHAVELEINSESYAFVHWD